MKSLIVLAVTLSLNFSFAADKKLQTVKAKPVAPSQKSEFILKVTSGEKVSEFNIIKEKKGGTLKFSSNLATDKQHSLTEKDMNYLDSEIKKLNESNDPKLCDSRHVIELVKPGKTITGCIGSSTKTAKKLVELANLFSAIVKL